MSDCLALTMIGQNDSQIKVVTNDNLKKGMIYMAMGDEVTSATLNVGMHFATKTIDVIAKLITSLAHIVQDSHRASLARQNSRQNVTSKDISLGGGEVELTELIKNAKKNRDTVIPIKDGLTENDRKFVLSKAKQYNLPVAFEKKEGLYYPIISGQDKEMYKHICTDLIRNKLADNAETKAYSNFGLQDWEVPFTNEIFNKYNVSAQFGKTADGQSFCLYNNADEAIVKIARNEFKRMHEEVKTISIDDDADYIALTDKNGHKVSVVKSDLPTYDELTELIQTKFNYDETKAKLLAARLGESLSDEDKTEFFNEDIRSKFSSIKTECVLEGESVLAKPYNCYRVKPKTDDIPRIIFVDDKNNFVTLQPERMNNERMKALIGQELGIKDERIANALVDKARAVSHYYNSVENSENKNYSYDIEKNGNYSYKGIVKANVSETVHIPYKVDNRIERNGKDTFTVSADFHRYSDENSIEKSLPLTLSLTDKATAVEELKSLYTKQGIGEYTAAQMAKECIKRAENQSADNVVQLESIKAEKFFDSDISSIKSAELELAMGDKKKIVSLADAATAKNDIMETFGVSDEEAEAVIETGTREMSDKQRSKLQEFGYDVDKLDVYDADYLLDNISKNHWQVPAEISPEVYVPKAESVEVPEIELPELPELPEISRGGM